MVHSQSGELQNWLKDVCIALDEFRKVQFKEGEIANLSNSARGWVHSVSLIFPRLICCILYASYHMLNSCTRKYTKLEFIQATNVSTKNGLQWFSNKSRLARLSGKLEILLLVHCLWFIHNDQYEGMEEEKMAHDERSGMSSNRTSYSELAKHFGVANQVGVKGYLKWLLKLFDMFSDTWSLKLVWSIQSRQ